MVCEYINNCICLLCKAPAVTDLASFPVLKVNRGCTNLEAWRSLLLKASEKSILTRQNLLTALIMAVYEQDCECTLQ